MTPSLSPISLTDLMKSTAPMVVGVLALMSFQLVDSYFIAKLGVEPLAVIGYTIPIYQAIIGVQVGIGIATTALISQRLGARNEHDANLLGGTILAFGTLTIALVCATIWILRSYILQTLGATPILEQLADELWPIFLISSTVGALLYFAYSISRAHGNTMLPGIGMVVTSILNAALDPLFIFTFELGLVGAAYASLAAFSLGLLFVIPVIIRARWIKILGLHLRQAVNHLKQISSIAAPAMISQILPAVSAMVATTIVSSHGTEAVAAWGVAIRLEFFSIILILALTMSVPPLVGRYFGANDIANVNLTARLAMRCILVGQVSLAIVFALSAALIGNTLSTDPHVSKILSTFLVIVPLSYAPLGICMLAISISNAINQQARALTISFQRLFICYLPCLAIGSHLGGMDGLMLGVFVGNCAAGLIAYRSYRTAIKKHQ
jgi:MATE family, multidrug efflux pump